MIAKVLSFVLLGLALSLPWSFLGAGTVVIDNQCGRSIIVACKQSNVLATGTYALFNRTTKESGRPFPLLGRDYVGHQKVITLTLPDKVPCKLGIYFNGGGKTGKVLQLEVGRHGISINSSPKDASQRVAWGFSEEVSAFVRQEGHHFTFVNEFPGAGAPAPGAPEEESKEERAPRSHAPAVGSTPAFASPALFDITGYLDPIATSSSSVDSPLLPLEIRNHGEAVWLLGFPMDWLPRISVPRPEGGLPGRLSLAPQVSPTTKEVAFAIPPGEVLALCITNVPESHTLTLALRDRAHTSSTPVTWARRLLGGPETAGFKAEVGEGAWGPAHVTVEGDRIVVIHGEAKETVVEPVWCDERVDAVDAVDAEAFWPVEDADWVA